MGALLLTADLACSSKVSAAAQRAGRPLSVAMSVPALSEKAASQPVDLLMLDLTAPGLVVGQLLPHLKSLQTPPAVIVAFGPHVHEGKLRAAAEAGCDLVLARGQFHSQIDALLERYVPATQ